MRQPRAFPPGLRLAVPLSALLLALPLTALPLALPAAATESHVRVEGEVRQPGEYRVADGARFADAVLTAMPTPQAYALGAAALRPSALPEQRRLKAGLLYDLDTLAADPAVPPAVAARLPALRAWLASLPVTGRVRADLDPRRLELDTTSNRLLADGDRLVYPPRPDTVSVVGAVARPCTLAHVPLRNAADYLRDCAVDAAADRDLLYAIQPDGEVQRLGIAAWNRSAPQALAPGAVLYVPLDERALRDTAPEFNAGVAGFLATQPLEAGGVERLPPPSHAAASRFPSSPRRRGLSDFGPTKAKSLGPRLRGDDGEEKVGARLRGDDGEEKVGARLRGDDGSRPGLSLPVAAR